MFSSFSAWSARRRGAARLAAATLVSGLVAAGALATAGAAAADDAPRSQGGATATIGGLKTYGAAVVHDNGVDQQVSAGLFEMSVDGGGMLQTYCIDLHNPTQRDAQYQETSWSGTSLNGNKDAGEDPLDPAALLPTGERPRGAGRHGRRARPHRAGRGGRHPGGHLAVLGRRRRGRAGPAGGEARRLPAEERAERGGAQGLADPRPARGLRAQPARGSARSRCTPTRTA